MRHDKHHLLAGKIHSIRQRIHCQRGHDDARGDGVDAGTALTPFDRLNHDALYHRHPDFAV